MPGEGSPFVINEITACPGIPRNLYVLWIGAVDRAAQRSGKGAGPFLASRPVVHGTRTSIHFACYETTRTHATCPGIFAGRQGKPEKDIQPGPDPPRDLCNDFGGAWPFELRGLHERGILGHEPSTENRHAFAQRNVA